MTSGGTDRNRALRSPARYIRTLAIVVTPATGIIIPVRNGFSILSAAAVIAAAPALILQVLEKTLEE